MYTYLSVSVWRSGRALSIFSPFVDEAVDDCDCGDDDGGNANRCKGEEGGLQSLLVLLLPLWRSRTVRSSNRLHFNTSSTTSSKHVEVDGLRTKILDIYW